MAKINKKIMAVEIQKEFNVLNKNWQEQVFIKLYTAARTSGFLADISDRNWKTLCVLATFMDNQGNCFPSQAEIATALGVCRQVANERIRSLLNYRWQDKPIVTVAKHRKKVTTGKKGQRWDNNRYTILPLGGGGKPRKPMSENPMSGKPDIGKPVSGKYDIGKNLDFPGKKPMSGFPDTRNPDTKRSVVVNKYNNNKKNNNSSTAKNDRAAFHLGEHESTDREDTVHVWEKIHSDVRAVAGVDISTNFAKEIARKYPKRKVELALEEMRHQLGRGIDIRNVGAWLRYALANEIRPEHMKGGPITTTEKEIHRSSADDYKKRKKAFLKSLYITG